MKFKKIVLIILLLSVLSSADSCKKKKAENKWERDKKEAEKIRKIEQDKSYGSDDEE
jgi:hypothetical protein